MEGVSWEWIARRGVTCYIAERRGLALAPAFAGRAFVVGWQTRITGWYRGCQQGAM
jgi:hypothetical protein